MESYFNEMAEMMILDFPLKRNDIYADMDDDIGFPSQALQMFWGELGLGEASRQLIIDYWEEEERNNRSLPTTHNPQNHNEN